MVKNTNSRFFGKRTKDEADVRNANNFSKDFWTGINALFGQKYLFVEIGRKLLEYT